MFAHQRRAVNELGPELLASVHQCESPLATQFFSAQNIAVIQGRLRQIIYDKTGYTIGRQSDEQLALVMRAMYLWHANHDGADMRAELDRLNSIVLSEVVPMVGTGIAQHIGYIRDASELPVPLDRARNMSIKGNNTLEVFRGF